VSLYVCFKAINQSTKEKFNLQKNLVKFELLVQEGLNLFNIIIVLYKFIRSLLFLLPAESAHQFTFLCLKWVCKVPFVKALLHQYYFVENSFEFEGIRFPNRVGLAAGFDKNAAYLNELAALGFGFVEIGTVTPLAQAGNEKPRLFRLKKDSGIINRMGFNNDGVEVVIERLKNRPKGLIVGGNIGKNKITPNEEAVNDYSICFEKMYAYVDYFVVNVSSPNTPGLRALQEKGPLTEILSKLVTLRNQFLKQDFPSKPIFLKIAPDLTHTQLDDVIEIVKETGINGIVATNTTIERNHLQTDPLILQKIGNGGYSGKALFEHSTQVLNYLNQQTDSQLSLIGVGGIDSVSSAVSKVKNGASLVQLYTGFIYQGPGLVKQISMALKKIN
jgi:dihydroorotate dehydrogenase